MPRWLISTGIQAEVQHHGTTVLGSHNVGTTVGVSHVVAEELSLERLEDVDTMSLELQGVNGLSDNGVHEAVAAGVSGNALMLNRHGVVRNSVINHHVTLGARTLLDHLVGEESETMPVTVLVGVGSILVHNGTETHEHGLNGPLELREQEVVSGNRELRNLEAMDTDEREANALNIHVVNFGVDEDVITKIPTSARHL